jgi:uncharacterized ubiquitin-like protein YukD
VEGTEQTVNLRVQVVDLDSFTLDLMVPTYLPARDLTQRVARDAGLEAFWGDGRRRLYWLRARGRLMGDDETLGQLGVVHGELVYLLPEPPAGSGVVEQPPDYPQTHGYMGKGTVPLVLSVIGVVGWAAAWGLALSASRSQWTILAPALGLGLLCTSFSRHAWGGQPRSPRVAVTALLLFLVASTLAFVIPTLVTGESLAAVYNQGIAGGVLGLSGVMLGWLAWWGAVEPLPESREEQQEIQTAVAVVPCGLCGGDVQAEVRQECPYTCGAYFHVGCYQARVAVYRGDSALCAICNQRVA